jgi:hypothetical protein
MIRFILRRKYKDMASGGEGEHLFTVDADVPNLEPQLQGGGHSQYGYEITELVGCEVLGTPSTRSDK